MTPSETTKTELTDLFIIGGGVNGCGIARDAAGRGLSVALAEMNDLGGATSSASTKLFHGGLRYLEYFELRLVREALQERETLLKAMPHISWPMRFVLPYHKDMRFDGQTPAAKLLARVMPWMKGRRPTWMIRLGLALYDGLASRSILPGTTQLDLTRSPEGAALQPQFAKAFEYSDCWVEDARLVVLNARDAEARGARIMTRTKVVATTREKDHWVIDTEDTETGATARHHAHVLVNAAGPWVAGLLQQAIGTQTGAAVRLVRGSHIVTRKLFGHDKSYFFQGPDGRIIFAIPYERDFTLIGTTDADHPDPSVAPVCTPEEQRYLLNLANSYFRQQLTEADVVWTYSGVRPLYDDGTESASAATRDYTLTLDTDGAPVLSVFGGKITTYRRLAESALERIATVVPTTVGPWTAGAALPGGDFAVAEFEDLCAKLDAEFPFLGRAQAVRLLRAYGTEAWNLLSEAAEPRDLGQAFGAGLTAREVAWLMDAEFARTAEDVLWRRSKLGLRLSDDQTAALADWMADRRAGPRRAA